MSMCLSTIMSKISPIRPASVSTLRVPRQKELVVASFSRPKEGALLGRVDSSGEAAAVAAAGPSTGVVASEVVSGKRNASELPLAAVSSQRPSSFLGAPARFGLVDQLPIDSSRVGGAAAYLGALLKGADGTRKVREELEVRYLAEATFPGRSSSKAVHAIIHPVTEATDVTPAMYMYPRMASTGGKERGGGGKGGAEGGLLG
jgi:hypothetical protein